MIKTTLHFTHGDFEDELTVEADTLDELREIANAEVARRNPDEYWSSNTVET